MLPTLNSSISASQPTNETAQNIADSPATLAESEAEQLSQVPTTSQTSTSGEGTLRLDTLSLSRPQAVASTSSNVPPIGIQPSSSQQSSVNQPSTPQPRNNRTTPAEHRNGRTQQLQEFLDCETETLELLLTLTNHATQNTDEEANQFGQTVSQMVKHIRPERRENLFAKLIEAIRSQNNFDEEVVRYGQTVMHLLQNMQTANRKRAYKDIVNLINNYEQDD